MYTVHTKVRRFLHLSLGGYPQLCYRPPRPCTRNRPSPSSASPDSDKDNCFPTSHAARSAIVCAKSPAAAATSKKVGELCSREEIHAGDVPDRCLATASIDLTRPRSCVSRLSRYDLCLSNHCHAVSATQLRGRRSRDYLVSFVEPRTGDRLANRAHKATLLLRNLRFAVLDLQSQQLSAQAE